jgi:Signal transduction histidine kinase
VPLPNLVRTSAFRLIVLYTVVFAVSASLLLAFIYWRTVALIDRQARDTIESEIRGLAEQYQQRGILGLAEVIELRAKQRGNDDHVYLLTSPTRIPLAGNLEAWPETLGDAHDWVPLTVIKMDEGRMLPHANLARMLILPGGYHLLVGRDMHERDKFRQIVLEALGWSSAAIVLLGLVGGIVLSRRMLGRVETIALTARRIMAGDLSQRVKGNGSGDEFDRLAAILNAMLDRTERLMAGMRLATDSLAHDLRRPLTRLRSRAELALLQPPSAEDDRDALVDMLRQSDAALSTFENLLKIAMAESGPVATELRRLDLAKLACDAAELYEPLAEEKNIAFVVEAAGPASILGHPELLAQSVTNLLDNAVKYTPEDGRISVSVASSADAVTLVVADSGPGVPEKDRQRVLDRFVRLDECRSTPGSGLGLALVSAVARLHDAALLLDDNAPGLRISLVFAPAAPENNAAGAAAVGAATPAAYG